MGGNTAQATRGFTLRGMDHFTVITTDNDRTQAFYELLGLRVGPRPPDLGGTGLWLYQGDKPILHVIAKGELPSDTAGMLDHMAFRATGLRNALAMLKEHGAHHYCISLLEQPAGSGGGLNPNPPAGSPTP